MRIPTLPAILATLTALCSTFALAGRLSAEDWPALPPDNAAVAIPAQEWPVEPGPRTIKVAIHYPDKSLASVTETTGLMLSLHNWGGSGCAGTANPQELARRLDVVAICVDYLQSGRQAAHEDQQPYDFGYLQALDALRALWFVFDGLQQAGVSFDSGRIFSTGGSGGGNVTQMANKLAPWTFTCIVDMCGMAKLSDDIAFNEPGGSRLNARYSRNPDNPHWLSPAAQELRFIAKPEHLALMRKLQTSAKVVVVHGVDDATCPFADKQELVENMQAAGIDVEPHFITQNDLDGEVFTSSGHPLGNRTKIVFQVAGKYLEPGTPTSLTREGPTDFERRDSAVKYPVTGGRYVISYAKGYPVGEFIADETTRPEGGG